MHKWIHNLCSNFPIGIGLFWKNIKFEPFFVVLHAHMTPQSIRHSKLHDIRSNECPNRTIFVDFRPFEFLVSYHKNQGERDIWHFDSDHKVEPFPSSHMLKHHLNRSGTQSYIVLDTKSKSQISRSPWFLCYFTRNSNGLKSTKMVRFGYFLHLLLCIFGCLIDWDVIGPCRSKRNGSNCKFF